MTLQQRFDTILGSLTHTDGAGLPSFLLGVSGGVDSMLLATLFANSSLKPQFEVAHVNFSLRGDDSDADQTLVQKWCETHGRMLHVQRFDTLAFAREHNISIEMAARELRYSWFDRMLDERGLDLLAVAHNRNDNVETLFLNLLRGTGLKGACGMQQLSGRIFRPLLGMSRAEIETFATEAGVKWRTDATNLDSGFARNRIRNEIFPQLERINPSFLHSISDSMQHFAQARDILNEEFEEKKNALSRHEDNALLIDIPTLKAMEHRGYWLFRLLEDYGFNSAQIEGIERTLEDEQAGKTFHSNDFTLVRDRQYLKLYRSGFEIEEPEVEIIGRPPEFDPRSLPEGTLCIDAAKVNLPLSARLWNDGDRFTPLGMCGSRLVSDFLTDLKLDREKKRRQCVIVDNDGKIVCIKGMRIDEHYRITDATKKIAIIS